MYMYVRTSSEWSEDVLYIQLTQLLHLLNPLCCFMYRLEIDVASTSHTGVCKAAS